MRINMDIKDDTLRKMLAGPFGWNLKKQNLLEITAGSDSTTDGQTLTVLDKELSERAALRLVASEVNKQKNMEDVVRRADEILQKEPKAEQVSEESDQEWVEECLEGAGKAYNENLKDYWAKLLAGEIKHPGYYSKRTISFMKSISQKDAEKIRNMCQYVMYSSDGTLPLIMRYKKAKYSYKDLSFLMELRLLDSTSTVVSQLRFPGADGHVFYRKKGVGIFLQIDKKEYDLPIYSFTELGKEVLTIIDDMEVNIDYLKEFATKITERDKSLHVVCGDLSKRGDSYYFIENDRYFEIPEKKEEEEKKTE